MKKISALSVIILCILSMLQLAYIEKPIIETPREGDVLQGSITVKGSIDVIGFQSFEVYFGYNSDVTNTWFLLEQRDEPVNRGVLTVWDTTQITDGNYRILVKVFVEDSDPIEVIIPNLRVRNYTPVETSTPSTLQESTQPADNGTPGNNLVGSTPTKSTENPAEITVVSLFTNVVKGIGIAFLLLLLIAAFLYIRGRSR